MRVAIDSLSAAALPDFISMCMTADVDTSTGIDISVFDAFDPPATLTAKFSLSRPDVIVVDVAWLAIASLLHLLIDQSGIPNVRRVVGSNSVTNVQKIEALHQRMFDIIDTSDKPDVLRIRLLDIHAGESQLERDPLWEQIPKPSRNADTSVAPFDSVDRAILELVRIGLRDRDIALALHYSEQSVKNRLSAMLRRTGLDNRTQLAWSFTNQLLAARMMMGFENQRRST